MGVIGVDVGGTTVKGGVVTPGGIALRRRVACPRHRGPEAVVETVVDTVDELMVAAARRGVEIEAVGLAVLGIVDEAEMIARWSAAVGWRDVPLGTLVAERVGVPGVLGHDVRAAAVAEATLGAGRGHRNVVFLALGTGLSAAQVIDGEVLSGASWWAGEIGQLQVDGRSGERTVLEDLVSGRALAERYARETGGSAERVDATVVLDAATGGNAVARRVLDEALGHLSDVLAVVISFADPSAVIVGGGLSLAGAQLLEPLAARVATTLSWRECPPVVAAQLGDEAGWVGAALLAWRQAGHPDDLFPWE